MKIALFSLLSFIISLSCFALYTSIGSHLDEQGMLIEPFFLIPLTYFFLLLGLLTLVIPKIIRKLQK